ncbi:hypothetical protein CC1G_15067 [Coprinopsis cinerea okayama7|uniref:Uncharacterized protein n=1 Tax=Coprinopsis cinerea (strain Okayama-7 / 130 / ATCC MYA-4618 / FGSC 9003) TaxID=240176 RepID=D6RP81_COPC7|nr:hypothetical protein CC1G_15067 [Coprinopsis cinerea okayama7\|eukprot:XP_002910733.1 hypothetical protein CC1G_15067 [Coprinopsis cinerea okayama7\
MCLRLFHPSPQPYLSQHQHLSQLNRGPSQQSVRLSTSQPYLRVLASRPVGILSFWSSGVLEFWIEVLVLESSSRGLSPIADREDRAESDRSPGGKVLDNRLRNIYYREALFIVELVSYREVLRKARIGMKGMKATSKEYR